MKRAEQLAWGALAGLVVVFGLLLTGACLYNFSAFWAGTMLVGGQAVVVGLAAWGLMLARQVKEMEELPALPSDQRFRMSTETATTRRGEETEAPSKTMDNMLQRLLVGIAGTVMLGLGGLAAWRLSVAYAWSNNNPELPFPIAGSFDLAKAGKPSSLDEMALLLGLSMALLYGVLYWITRPRRETGIYGEAVSSNFTLGLTAMAALAVGTTVAYFGVAWASEVAAGVIAAFMLLQGTELLVNAFRSYSAIEELDQDVVDLQATPLGPMLSSIWLAGLRILFAQSVGLSGRKERGVIARMMPRVLGAIVVIAVAASCFRVVPPGQVAVLERLGAAPTTPIAGHENMLMLLKEGILQPGLHICWPWPIDKLVMIPTEQLQTTSIGTELHAPKDWGKKFEFQFWTMRSGADSDTDDLFVTGDPAPQILETFVQVQWRVDKPELFYSLFSHSDFAEMDRKSQETKLVPVYEAIIKQCASFAVTRTFAIHSLEQVMISDRREVEEHCKEILQEKLDSFGREHGLAGSGISINFLTIRDLHPPFWRPDRENPAETPIGGLQIQRGPASAFEFVVSMSELRDRNIALAEGERTFNVTQAEGLGQAEINRAQAYAIDKIARARGEADRLLNITKDMDPQQETYLLHLMEQRLLYSTLKDSLDPVYKVVTDPDVKDVQIWQGTTGSDKNAVPLTPVGR